jgi:pimeloyl-ACP methyl ester carboxylesterase
MSANPDRVWTDYYRRFTYFAPETVRAGCHPRVYRHADGSDKAIVLVHGLTDSPYFMTAIARYFHTRLGYDAYLPLLHCHGLTQPNGMNGVDLGQWKANVRFAIRQAAERAARVSIGGLSTGGALSFYMACTKPRINGGLYLFSAALDLAGGPLGLFGEFKERLLRTPIAGFFDSDQSLIGANPYRYEHMDMDGAKELSRLMRETDDLLKGFDAKTPFPKRVFAAHSECDTTADITGIKKLQGKTAPGGFTEFFIPAAIRVSHAELVLDSPIRALDAAESEPPLENANPQFDQMMAAVAQFESAG